MSMMDTGPQGTYEGTGMTKQSFKDSTDINKILARAARGESISHLQRHGAVYADFSDIADLMHAYDRLEKGKQIFAELPAEVRKEFNQSPFEFFTFVNDPENRDQLDRVLPDLARPGRQMPVPNARSQARATEETGEVTAGQSQPAPAANPSSGGNETTGEGSS